MAASTFCPGYPAPYDALVADAPGQQVYPSADFRTEWGPIFHRGRLDGTAQVLVLGQDPAVEETITRRILVGVAGQRTQGLLAKIGITQSYLLINTFLYSVSSQVGGDHHIADEAIAAYRNRWLDVATGANQVRAVITLGTLAMKAFAQWSATPTGSAFTGHHAAVLHPTYPESASAHGQVSLATATNRLLAGWNAAIPGLIAAIPNPDQQPASPLYGTDFTSADLPEIPAGDLPPGVPGWMRIAHNWARRTGGNPDDKRATITVTVPKGARQWPPLATPPG
jgi:hypothetical protein